MQIFYSPIFKKRYKKLPKNLRLQTQKKEALFRKNPFEPSLGTHKLQGRMRGLCAFWVTNSFRIIFEFVTENVVRFHTVDTHDAYK